MYKKELIFNELILFLCYNTFCGDKFMDIKRINEGSKFFVGTYKNSNKEQVQIVSKVEHGYFTGVGLAITPTYIKRGVFNKNRLDSNMYLTMMNKDIYLGNDHQGVLAKVGSLTSLTNQIVYKKENKLEYLFLYNKKDISMILETKEKERVEIYSDRIKILGKTWLFHEDYSFVPDNDYIPNEVVGSFNTKIDYITSIDDMVRIDTGKGFPLLIEAKDNNSGSIGVEETYFKLYDYHKASWKGDNFTYKSNNLLFIQNHNQDCLISSLKGDIKVGIWFELKENKIRIHSNNLDGEKKALIDIYLNEGKIEKVILSDNTNIIVKKFLF